MAAIEAGRPYLSIGEVLNVLKEEFPDVTVSKIRFLESEGLIDPERTQSGYRKFSEQDIERLRFVLRLQRDHFLPLKVIRERLDEAEAAGGFTGQGALSFDAAPAEASDEPIDLATGVSLSRDELAKVTGLTDDQIAELETFALLNPTEAEVPTEEGVRKEKRFDEIDLEAGKLCRQLLDLGLEPRHLRVFRSAVDRWAALAEQMVSPLVKQRNPEARKAAEETVRELVRIGNRLMQTLLREAVGPYA